MSQKPDPPRESNPSSPLISAIKSVKIPPPSRFAAVLKSGQVSPWRRNLEESIRTCVPDNVRRSGLGDKFNAIERAAGNKEDLVITRLNEACRSIAALGQDAVCSFVDAMYLVSIRARTAYPDAQNGAAGISENVEKRAKSICTAADRLCAIASNVSSERVFCLVCAGMERIRDLKVLSKYVNYMFAASREIRSERNPEGTIKGPDVLAFQAKFIAERSDGTNAAYVDALLTKLIMKLNDLAMKGDKHAPGTP